ncbi:MAG: hypothetical protein Q4A07_12055 [Coriobacteriales bacterium]|nr:hypothetical protein [Coriobacteriales bacterium]
MPNPTYDGLVDIDRLSLYHDKAKQLFATRAAQEALATRVGSLEDAGGEPNAIESVRVNGTALAPDATKAVDVTVPTKVSDLPNDSGYQTSAQVNSAISSAVTTALASAVRYRGSVATTAELPSQGNAVGDMWNVSADGMNHVWTGSVWDAHAPTVDLSGLVASSEVTLATNAQVNALFD